jgi:hypothetical protein
MFIPPNIPVIAPRLFAIISHIEKSLPGTKLWANSSPIPRRIIESDHFRAFFVSAKPKNGKNDNQT